MELVYTDSQWTELGVVENFGMDLAFGMDENDFTIEIPYGLPVEEGSFLFVDGTSWGGMVRGFMEEKDDFGLRLYAIGQTWHGLMKSTVLRPPAGRTHFTVDCTANEAISQVVAHTGLGMFFDVSAEDSPHVTYQFDRFCDVYAGLKKMLSRNGLKLVVEKPPQSHPVLRALPIADYTSGELALDNEYRISKVRAVNHLVCIGIGEMEERTVVDLYADEEGNVSRTQSIFWPYYRQKLYEYSSLEEEQLVEAGTKKLEELRKDAEAVDIHVTDETALDVGDKVGAQSEFFDMSVSAEVSKVIVKVGESGPSVSYEAGDSPAMSTYMVW